MGFVGGLHLFLAVADVLANNQVVTEILVSLV